MKRIDWKQLTKRRTLGAFVTALGLVVLFMPVFVGGWIIALLGIALVAAGLFQFVEIIRAGDENASRLAYAAGIVTTLLGIVLFLSPNLALSGLLIAATGFFLVDGGVKIYGAYKLTGAERWWSLFNGLFTAALGLTIWYFVTAQLGLVALGVILGLRLLVEGWTLVFLPEKSFEPPDFEPDERLHPDYRLALAENDAVAEIQKPLRQFFPLENGRNVAWCLSLLGIFFLIHVLRTDARWSFIGLISPFAAVIGDAVVALLLAIVVILPARLLWRKLTRPLERAAWRRFFFLREKNEEPTIPERLLRFWLAGRMRFALEMRELRYSLNFAFWRVLRFGLPLTAILIAVNSIWGFSWYFNSENWASGVWQEITKERVDVWRKKMVEAVEKDARLKGVAPEKIFAVEPEGTDADGDFSFVVIGDTGEGDPSQMALRDQIIAAGKREQVKFLVLSSDVIYPDGKMKDYETNFYLPFKGFEKPIYAIPGNHDWYDANEGFNANFLMPDAAQLALRARLAEDLNTEAITTDQRFDEITAEAARLREYYRIRNGLQRAPFFELHASGFSLIAVDTGILRRVDDKERAWLEAALARAGNNFKIVVLGHPFYVAGAYQAAHAPEFEEIYKLLQRFEVDVAMAGDTHDFEFYRAKNSSGEKEMLHFVNGGGGAYLSVGTALGFPENPAIADYAFYPRTDELTAKINRETPFWKMPFYWWMKWLHGYPFDDEMVSGAFDFNRAPYFQSFLEVSVERSQNRVRFLLYGANGQLRWRDIQTGGAVVPAGKSPEDPVEFIAPLQR
ncbi:MAG TPA: metallophosphoesterase [Pyrinomonadaceae bacterium]